MLNENPIQPSEKVVEAVAQAIRQGNRYPDSFLRLRTKIGDMYGLGRVFLSRMPIWNDSVKRVFLSV
jgi:histidinol-phosphate/aromatic aminotransferase/cobyric acid decarboxylase-like protein